MAANRLIHAGGWAAMAAAALLAGCAPKKAPPPPAPSPVRPAPPAAVALDPESYMAFTASSALFGVQASRMAEARGSTSAARNSSAA